jgi:uncharacterized coiled-coil protein SlyX
MTNNQADPMPSVTSQPQDTSNTVSQGEAQTHVPQALLRAPLLHQDNHQVRSLMADGTTKHHAPFLALRHASKLKRKALVLTISDLLGDDMVVWHSALHRPQDLPESAFDWSTVLLQEMLDLAKSMPDDFSRQQRLYGVHQAMTPESKRSGSVVAGIHFSTPGSKRPKNKKMHQLKQEVVNLQQQVEAWKKRLGDERTLYEVMSMILEKPRNQNLPGAEGASSHDVAAQQKMLRLESRVESRDCTIEDLDLALATQRLTIHDLKDERPVTTEKEGSANDPQDVSPFPRHTLALRQRIRHLERVNDDSLIECIDALIAKDAVEKALENARADYQELQDNDPDYNPVEVPNEDVAKEVAKEVVEDANKTAADVFTPPTNRPRHCRYPTCPWPSTDHRCQEHRPHTAYVSKRRSSDSESSEEL